MKILRLVDLWPLVTQAWTTGGNSMNKCPTPNIRSRNITYGHTEDGDADQERRSALKEIKYL